MKKSTKIMAGLVAAVLSVSAVGFAFSRWSSDITLSGNISASGKWDVEVTDASLEVSSAGADVTALKVEDGVALVSTGTKVSYTASSIIVRTDDPDLAGTQSTEDMSKYTYYYAIDTSKYPVENLNSLTKDERAEIVADESTVTISDVLKMYYFHLDMSDISGSYLKPVNGMIADTNALLKEKYPDTYQNYALVYMSSIAKYNYVIADTRTVYADADASISGTSAQYADVTYTLPGAWANYTVTVTNNGTVNANLSEYSFDFTSLDSSIFTVEQPTGFDSEVLKPGESCTFSFVVKANDDADSDELSAESTSFTVTLNYVQDTVEEAPAAGHSHS